MTDIWYLNRNGRQYGPYTFDVLKQFVYEKRLSPGDMVWQQGMQGWVRADEVQGLFNLGNAANNNMYMQPKKTKKKKRWLIWIYAVLSLLAAGFIAIAIFVPSEYDEKIKNVIPNAEGTVNIEGTAITLPDNRSVKDAEITIMWKGGRSPIPENVDYQSDIYEFEGYLFDLNGDIKIEIPLSEKALKLPYKDINELKKSLFIVLNEEVDAPSAGRTGWEKRIETAIDLDKKTVSAVISFPNKGEISGNRMYLASLASDAAVPPPIKRDESKQSIEVRVKRYKYFWEEIMSKEGSFKAVYSEDDVFRENVDLILDDLEEFKKRIGEELGFNLTGRSYPVEIHIESLKDEIGKYVPSKRYDDDAYIVLDKGFFGVRKESPKTQKANPVHERKHEEIRITAAHELLHLYQDLYNPGLNLFKSHAWTSKPLLWIDEASSTWFETVVSRNKDYFPDNAKKNINFINRSLCFTQSGDHGYGASLFMGYLIDKSGDKGVVSSVYKIIRREQNTDSTSALKETLNSKNMDLSSQWISFLESYILRPGDIKKGLETDKLIKEVKFEAKGSGENIKYQFVWGNDLEKNKLSSAQGSLNSDEIAASIKVGFQEGNLSADPFKLTVMDSSSLSELLKKPGTLNISVKSSGKCGVLLYENSSTPIAGTPWNFLGQSSDSRFKGKSEVSIGNFGNGINELLFIPFNYDTDSVAKTSEVTIDISYTPSGEGKFVGDWRGEFDLLDGSFKEYPQLGKGIRFVITSETPGTSGITHEVYYNSQGRTEDYLKLKAKVNRLHFMEITEIKENIISFRANFTSSKPQNKPCWIFNMTLSQDGNTMEGEYLEAQSNRRGHLKLTKYK